MVRGWAWLSHERRVLSRARTLTPATLNHTTPTAGMWSGSQQTPSRGVHWSTWTPSARPTAPCDCQTCCLRRTCACEPSAPAPASVPTPSPPLHDPLRAARLPWHRLRRHHRHARLRVRGTTPPRHQHRQQASVECQRRRRAPVVSGRPLSRLPPLPHNVVEGGVAAAPSWVASHPSLWLARRPHLLPRHRPPHCRTCAYCVLTVTAAWRCGVSSGPACCGVHWQWVWRRTVRLMSPTPSAA